MTILNDPEDFKVLEFYRYPTAVVRRIVEYDNGFHATSPDNVEDVKDLFEELLKVAEEKTGKDLMDNKVAMKVLYVPTNTIFYVGYKDWNWCIGLELNKYMTGESIVIEYDKE